jgi:hypothetical protein
MAENDTSTFDTWDYVVLGVMLVISAAIGVYYRFTGGRQKTTQVSITSPVSVCLQVLRCVIPIVLSETVICV